MRGTPPTRPFVPLRWVVNALISLMKDTLRIFATFGLAIYVYAKLAAHVYPFVLLPHLGIPFRAMALTLFTVLHAGENFGWRVGLLMFFGTTLVTWSFEQVGVVTGASYGAYHYSGMLGPKLGAVPLLMPLAWFMMIYPSYLTVKDVQRRPERGPRNTRKDTKGDERCGLRGPCHIARPDIGRGRDALLRDPAWHVQKTCNGNI